MPKFKNIESLKIIGERIKNQRELIDKQINDVAGDTGFSYDTIKKIEDGEETTLSYFIEVCKAIRIHPKKVLDYNIVLKARNENINSSPKRTLLTVRINKYIEDGFFKEYRSSKDVLEELKKDYKIQSSTAAISVILNRCASQNKLSFKTKNSRKEYIEV